jgi:DtxR family Mn-dependent transcriptional regulator
MATPSNGAHDSRIEDALKAILRIETDNGSDVGAGVLGEELRLAPGTVTTLVKDLDARGLVVYQPYRGVRLTPEGREQAIVMLRRHRLLELFLVEMLGMDWAEVHSEAERLEHVVSDRLAERLDETLGHPQVDPHGDPIPPRNGPLPARHQPSLLSCDERRDLTVSRISDQTPDFLQLVDRIGLRPGSHVRVEERDDDAEIVQLRVETNGEVRLGMQAAEKILVQY